MNKSRLRCAIIRRMTKNSIAIISLAGMLATTSAIAQGRGRGGQNPDAQPPAAQQAAPAAGAAAAAPRVPPPEEKTVETKHTIHIGGQEIKYTARAGTINIKSDHGVV